MHSVTKEGRTQTTTAMTTTTTTKIHKSFDKNVSSSESLCVFF